MLIGLLCLFSRGRRWGDERCVSFLVDMWRGEVMGWIHLDVGVGVVDACKFWICICFPLNEILLGVNSLSRSIKQVQLKPFDLVHSLREAPIEVASF